MSGSGQVLPMFFHFYSRLRKSGKLDQQMWFLRDRHYWLLEMQPSQAFLDAQSTGLDFLSMCISKLGHTVKYGKYKMWKCATDFSSDVILASSSLPAFWKMVFWWEQKCSVSLWWASLYKTWEQIEGRIQLLVPIHWLPEYIYLAFFPSTNFMQLPILQSLKSLIFWCL